MSETVGEPMDSLKAIGARIEHLHDEPDQITRQRLGLELYSKMASLRPSIKDNPEASRCFRAISQKLLLLIGKE